MKFEFKHIFFGIVMGVLLATLILVADADRSLAEAEAQLKNIEYVTSTLTVKEQVIRDLPKVEVVVVEEPEAVEVVEELKKAPFENIPLETHYQLFLESKCEEYDVDFWLAVALMESESSFDLDAVGDKGKSVGLMQINKCWWDADIFEDKNVYEPCDNIEMGLTILSDLLTRYEPVYAIQMYKCGEYRGRALLEEGVILDQAVAVVNRAEEIKGEAHQ